MLVCKRCNVSFIILNITSGDDAHKSTPKYYKKIETVHLPSPFRSRDIELKGSEPKMLKRYIKCKNTENMHKFEIIGRDIGETGKFPS